MYLTPCLDVAGFPKRLPELGRIIGNKEVSGSEDGLKRCFSALRILGEELVLAVGALS